MSKNIEKQEEEIRSNFNWDEDTWTIIDTYFKQPDVLVQHHLSSFDYFMKTQLGQIVKEKDFVIRIPDKREFNKDEESSSINRYFQVEFGKVYVSKPVLNDAPHKPMYPNDARLRNLSYSGNLNIDIHYKMVTVKKNPDGSTKNN